MLCGGALSPRRRDPWRRGPHFQRGPLLLGIECLSSKEKGSLLHGGDAPPPRMGVPPWRGGASSLDEGASPLKGVSGPWMRGRLPRVARCAMRDRVGRSSYLPGKTMSEKRVVVRLKICTLARVGRGGPHERIAEESEKEREKESRKPGAEARAGAGARARTRAGAGCTAGVRATLGERYRPPWP